MKLLQKAPSWLIADSMNNYAIIDFKNITGYFRVE